ncbi:DUF3016 domain-containing protein [Gayadomonas joobiniege]|uniref:DUF3016 domain-containing protein n=1 Tax=Gayadomonas joobiniege TaxID=1234606 RepID=UPI000365A8C5|nr:DUF3016 domain-containing protein [Gayadomonas joobiniege]
MQAQKYLLTAITCILSWQVTAGNSEIKWVEPEKYTDIKAPDSYTRKGYQEYVFSSFERYLEQASRKYLPDDQTIKLTVTELDLAGWVRPFGNSLEYLRVIEDGFIPRIKFDYKIIDEQGAVIDQGSANLKNMAMSEDVIVPPGLDDFKHEFAMIKHWFRDRQKNQK